MPTPQEIYDDGTAVPAPALAVPGFGDLTTTEEVRSLFGLSPAEIPDEMLAQPVYGREISLKLMKLSPRLATNWSTLIASSDPRDVQVVSLVKSWVAYAFADRICDVLPLVVARTLTDSKASFQRFDTDLQKVITSIRARFALTEAELQSLLDGIYVDATRLSLISSGRPTYDPVTGT